MIIATAGHVDHGKTSLVRALTGVDTDRLPEEKRRGMTIDLGFAYRALADGASIGFVDVPGHERFIHNMLAGVGGIDAALLVIAADDGPMPQTREHLAILDLLGVGAGVVALTKVDRVDPARVAQVRDEIAALLAGTGLAAATIWPVATPQGHGVAELSAALDALAHTLPARRVAGRFRMTVDRIFTIAGAGRVVTGTILTGRVKVGDSVRAQVAGATVRVRGLHGQHQAASTATAGQRCALNIVGNGREIDRIARGDWMTALDAVPPVEKLDGRLRLLATEAHALAHWTPVHLHLGAIDVTGRIAVLEAKSIAPGAEGLVQLVLERPLCAVYGDRFIVRDQSAQRTLGGGHVIDLFPPRRGRAKPARLALLRALDQADDARALAALRSAGFGNAATPVDVERFAASRNIETAALVAALPDVVKTPAAPVVAVAAKVGLDDSPDAALWQRLNEALHRTPERPPSAGELGKSLGVELRAVTAVLERAAKEGRLRRVAPGRYFPPARLDELARLAHSLKAFSIGEFRDASGLGRNLAIEVLEFFDRVRFTRRDGDRRIATRVAAELFPK